MPRMTEAQYRAYLRRQATRDDPKRYRTDSSGILVPVIERGDEPPIVVSCYAIPGQPGRPDTVPAGIPHVSEI